MKNCLLYLFMIVCMTVVLSAPPPELLLQWKNQDISVGIGVNPQTGDLFISKFMNDVHQYTYEGRKTSIIKYPELTMPCGIAIDSENNMYVTDQNVHCVFKFSSDGSYIKHWGGYGTGDLEFNDPIGIAVDKKDQIYVVDSENAQIKKFDKDGNFLFKFNTDEPAGIGITVDSTGNIYMPSWRNHCIYKFDEKGNLLKKWGTLGTEPGQFNNPGFVAVDSEDNVYVSEYSNSRVQKFDKDANFLLQWGDAATFNYPTGITINVPKGLIYILDVAYIHCFSILPILAETTLSLERTSTFVTLHWQDNYENEEGFEIQRAAGNSTNFKTIATTKANITEYVDYDVYHQSTYTYRVAPFAKGFNSQYSNSMTTEPASSETTSHCGATGLEFALFIMVCMIIRASKKIN